VTELDAYLQSRGKTAQQLLGLAADRLQSYGEQPDRPDYWQTFAPPTTA
jgi:hypothetical protein